MGIWKHVQAIIVLPVMVAVVVPGTILYLAGTNGLAFSLAPPWNIVLPTVGLIFILLGLVLLFATIRLFAAIGKGTLAPWNPTQKLVAHGIYRHVRNPMISGVCFILLGEAMMAASWPLLCWFGVFVLGNMVWIPWHEEPGLEKRFGEDYRRYKRNVPRWIPRLRPWDEGDADDG